MTILINIALGLGGALLFALFFTLVISCDWLWPRWTDDPPDEWPR